MRTLDNQTSERAGWLSRRRRDVRLVRRLIAMTFYYLGEGRRIRNEYKERERRGEVYWLDAADGPDERPSERETPQWRSS